MGMKELREMNTEDLKKELLELRREDFNLRMQKGLEGGPNPHQFRLVRNSIARIKTLIRSRELGEK
jgi:large subunit ribosomal protein L29